MCGVVPVYPSKNPLSVHQTHEGIQQEEIGSVRYRQSVIPNSLRGAVS